MLKPLVFKYHTIKKVQSFVNYLFLEVIFNNNVLAGNASFTQNLVINKYRGIINVRAEYLFDLIVEVFDTCKKLDRKEIKLLRSAVHLNNNIESLCKGETEPITYREIDKIDKNLSIVLRKMFGKLYKYVIDLQPVYSIYGHKKDFYKNIVGRETVCNCCGVGTILNIYQDPVGALDHYFPINHYPFSSINFENLIPICDICNSKYKTQKDTLFKIKSKAKRGIKKIYLKKYKAFYPYTDEYDLINVDISIPGNDVTNLSPDDIEITYSLPDYEEEVENWERLFKVSEIHKANLLSNESREYINQQFDFINVLGRSFEEYYDLINNNIFYNKNFIRLPYLKEFNRISGTS
ncbi:hypothetical protein M2T78_12725 [Elizabethkingia ursingii]|uniref:hypothetical protein n=1 Tax=Elizabethkingia ursingii TaxID=1756150 RepID=UPI0020119B4D|nr:hypothetical protein [Elizabethkingia ursingii]MCL1665125.1 hypothetical protein [Elizabethkingia ursingii]